MKSFLQGKKSKILLINSGEISPEEVDNWACPWIVNDHLRPPVDDFVVWDALMNLCGADLKLVEGGYLHCADDFKDWLNEFEKKCKENPLKDLATWQTTDKWE